ncbi:MAG TPA: DapH/DapD/GlmU-related protein [Vicinamibacterales bacterium]|nr:DapH/DapD/GlmU-related protein [Vicinamibacterales bacterium]
MANAVRAGVLGIDRPAPRLFGRAVWRIGWTVLTILLIQGLVCGAALLPVVLIWSEVLAVTESSSGLRAFALSVIAIPSYGLFALLLMFVSAIAVRALNWHTPANAQMRIADVGWPLLQWARSMVATHLVRILAGGLFRGTPVWAAYLRLAGAQLGRRVYVNSLAVTDYNLLSAGDDVVIGDGVHVSGHTVECGVVRTARVRIGSNVTLGLGSVIEIGVEVGDDCQIGALTFVPKHTRLDAGATYVGIPAVRIRG